MKILASDWAKAYARARGFSIYSKQILAVLAFLDALDFMAEEPAEPSPEEFQEFHNNRK